MSAVTPATTVASATTCTCDAQRQVENLEIALGSSRRIGLAMGILMASYKLSENEAFDLLVVVSQHHNRKVRDIADDVVLTGSLDWVLNESA